MSYSGQARYASELQSIRDSGLFKDERIITSPQSAEITLADGRKVLNFCANNYLGLADHPRLIEAAGASGSHQPHEQGERRPAEG